MNETDDPEAFLNQVKQGQGSTVGRKPLERRIARLGVAHPSPNTPGQCGDAGLTDSGRQRWGDYSAVTVDPTNALKAGLVNEKVNSLSVWGTRIGLIGF